MFSVAGREKFFRAIIIRKSQIALMFFRGIPSEISFTSRIAPHKRSEFVTFTETLRSESLQETIKKEKSPRGKSKRSPEPKKLKAEVFDEAKAFDLTFRFFLTDVLNFI